jgi:hypothetical protein
MPAWKMAGAYHEPHLDAEDIYLGIYDSSTIVKTITRVSMNGRRLTTNPVVAMECPGGV